MKRALCGAVAAVALVGGVAPAVAMACSGGGKGPEKKVTFCHYTHSATNPYNVITTANVALVRAHLINHHDDAMVNADGSCPVPPGSGGGDGGPSL